MSDEAIYRAIRRLSITTCLLGIATICNGVALIIQGTR